MGGKVLGQGGTFEFLEDECYKVVISYTDHSNKEYNEQYKINLKNYVSFLGNSSGITKQKDILKDIERSITQIGNKIK